MAGSTPSTSKRVNILDADFEEHVLKWYNEIDSDCSDIENEDAIIESDHNSESEQDVDELTSDDDDTEYLPDTENTEVSDEDILSEGEPKVKKLRQEKKYIYGKNRCKWSLKEISKPKPTTLYGYL
nr:unnamed protein product [Callosobruchus analis]